MSIEKGFFFAFLILLFSTCKHRESKDWLLDYSIAPSGFDLNKHTPSHTTPMIVLRALVLNNSNDTLSFFNKKDTTGAFYATLTIGGSDTILLDKCSCTFPLAPGTKREIIFFEDEAQFIHLSGLGWVYGDSLGYYNVYNQWIKDSIRINIHFRGENFIQTLSTQNINKEISMKPDCLCSPISN